MKMKETISLVELMENEELYEKATPELRTVLNFISPIYTSLDQYVKSIDNFTRRDRDFKEIIASNSKRDRDLVISIKTVAQLLEEALNTIKRIRVDYLRILNVPTV